MKGWIIYVIMIVATGVSYAIFKTLPEYIQQGGPLIIALMVMTIMVLTFIIERMWTLKQAGGKGDLGGFVRKLKNAVHGGKLDEDGQTRRQAPGHQPSGRGAPRRSAHRRPDSPAGRAACPSRLRPPP